MMIFYVILLMLIITACVSIVVNIDFTKQPVNVDIKHTIHSFNFNVKEHGNLLDVSVAFGNNYQVDGFEESAEKIAITIPFNVRTFKEIDIYLRKAVDELNNGREGFKHSYLAEVLLVLLLGKFPRTKQFRFDTVALLRLGITRKIFTGYLKNRIGRINSARY